MPSQAIPEMSASARLLHARLAKATVGETIAYQELADIAKVSRVEIQGKKRYLLQTACNAALKNEMMVFESVTGVGLKRMDDSGVAATTTRGLRKIHRACNRSIRKASTLSDLNKLQPDERTRFLATTSCLGAIAHATKETAIKRISVEVEKKQARLPLDETLAAFR